MDEWFDGNVTTLSSFKELLSHLFPIQPNRIAHRIFFVFWTVKIPTLFASAPNTVESFLSNQSFSWFSQAHNIHKTMNKWTDKLAWFIWPYHTSSSLSLSSSSHFYIEAPLFWSYAHTLIMTLMGYSNCDCVLNTIVLNLIRNKKLWTSSLKMVSVFPFSTEILH